VPVGLEYYNSAVRFVLFVTGTSQMFSLQTLS
jgi:hypothetical protein